MLKRHQYPILPIQALLSNYLGIKFLVAWLIFCSIVVDGTLIGAPADSGSLYKEIQDQQNLIIPVPVQIIESQTEVLIRELSARKEEFDRDPQSLVFFARNMALSHWDLAKTSRLMLGKYWKNANSEQQALFEEEFLRTLLRYIVKAYGYYDESLVEILSYDWQPKGSKGTGGWVRSVVRLPAGMKVSVDYRMNKNKQQQWKLVDVRIEGISLVTTKRNEYRGIARQKGLDALIKAMSEKNQKVLKT